MPYRWGKRRIRIRSNAGRELDASYERHEIGWAHYRKIWNKPKYWEWGNSI